MNTTSRLNCSEFDDLLWEENADRVSLEVHVAECSRCADVWDDHQAIERVVGVWAEVPAVDLADRVVAAWRGERATAASASASPSPMRSARPMRSTRGANASPARGRFAALAASIAAVLLAVGLFAFVPVESPSHRTAVDSNNAATDANERLAGDAGPVRPEPAADGDVIGVVGLVGDFRQRYTGLSSDVSTLMASVRQEIPPLNLKLDPMGSDSMERNPEPTGRPVERPAKPRSSWRSGWDPIQKDVRKAFGFLADAVPMDETPST